MSLTYPQAKQLCQQIAPSIEGAVCADIAVLSERTIVLSLQKDKRQDRLLLCFKDPFLRFHFCSQNLSERKPPKDPFFSKLGKVLKGGKIVDCSLLNEDRILSLSFHCGEETFQLVAEFIPRHPNCYLLDKKQQILAALHGDKRDAYLFPEKHQGYIAAVKLVEEATSEEIERHYAHLEAEAEFQKLYKRVVSGLEKGKRRAEANVAELQKKLAECLDWNSVQHEGLLLQANQFRICQGMSEIVINDWLQQGKERTIILDPLVQSQKQIETLFHRARKLRLGIVHVKKQVQNAVQKMAECEQQLKILADIHDLSGLEKFCLQYGLESVQRKIPLHPKKTEVPKPYHNFTSEQGVTIWVGKSAKDNDAMTFTCANGSDWWMHVSDYPGSHVVLRTHMGQEPDEKTIQDAAELALRYSKAKNANEADITFTQVKYLKRIKEAPGKVMVSKHRTVHIRKDESRWLRLKSNKCASQK